MEKTEFILIRHGQTAENIAGRLQGHFDSKLDDTGIMQARAAAERLATEKADVIYSSDLQRARKTAEIIAGKMGLEVNPMPELREWKLGELEGRYTKELWQEYPEIMDCFLHDSDDVEVPGGESFAQFNRRVSDALEMLAEKHAGKKVVLVTHGGVMRAVFRHIAGRVGSNLLPLLSNASYSRFCKRDGAWQLCVWNDVSHLNSIGVRESATF